MGSIYSPRAFHIRANKETIKLQKLNTFQNSAQLLIGL